MIENNDIPFNITLLELTPNKLHSIIPISTLDDFSRGDNFNPNGLFSTEIFGKVGDPLRSKRFSYIDIKIDIFHPIIYNALIDLKRLYAGIINGSEYVLWNDEIKDFERSNPMVGKTGFNYFMTYWKDIVFKKNDSIEREQNIRVVEKYKNTATTNKIIVMPAGLRDMEITIDGRKENDEINTFYRKLLAISNSISDANIKTNRELINNSRYSLQITFNGLYDMIEDMIKGKKKLLLGKWASRKVFNGTRNVITSMDTNTSYLGAGGSVSVNDTYVGLYQAMKCIMPVTRYMLKNGLLSKVFISSNMPAKLVDKKTKKCVDMVLRNEYYDKWMTDEGLEKVITKFQENDTRDKYLEIEGHYVGLIYKGPDGTFKIIQDIDEVPGSRSKLDVFPITYSELMYLSCYVRFKDIPVILTRYPITGVGSTVPTMMHVKTTIKSEVRRELNDNWEIMDDDHIAYEFPIPGPYLNSVAPHSTKLSGLGADFDGDTVSITAVYSEEAIKEVKNFLGSKRAYVGTDGKFKASVSTDTINFIMYNLTAD